MEKTYYREKGGSKMKRYAIFIVTFILLLFGFQLASGMLQTMMYTPNQKVTAVRSDVVFGSTQPSIGLIIMVAAATLAYAISNLIRAKRG
ncbi:hypothetical protein [Priestia koreensis]|uniref:hypothetical protein n=1 Tax=Priestia koreensis TaxID=284581 RepID=UPI001F56D13E|nr:hypothetical protein [Priestia koreensis]MCM3005163.1 hypothetical protein [Priestia koreensis]UNL83149.1 hypothetical protein IE339_13195 [Priestia koreensis]